jgi:hypothetical protein
VPIALNAYDEPGLEDRIIITIAGLGGAFGQDVWVRPAAALYVFGISDDSGLPDFYRLTEEVDAALGTGGFPGILAANVVASQIPILTAWNEGAIVAGVPTEFDWDAVSGRAVLDWQVTPDMLAYASYARGYKPGGLRPESRTPTRRCRGHQRALP